MSQVDDWSDGYTSDYLRDLNTYGPASANVPRSSVVSHRVQYRAPDTSDIPLAPGQNPEGSVYSNASGARMGQLKPRSGYNPPAGGGYTAQTFPSSGGSGKRYARPKPAVKKKTQSASKQQTQSASKQQPQPEYRTGGARTPEENEITRSAAEHRTGADLGQLSSQALDAAARFLPALKLLGFGAGAGSADTASTDRPSYMGAAGTMADNFARTLPQPSAASRQTAPESSSIEGQFENMPWYEDAKAHHEAVKKNMDDYGFAKGMLKSTWDDIPWWAMMDPAGAPARAAAAAAAAEGRRLYGPVAERLLAPRGPLTGGASEARTTLTSVDEGLPVGYSLLRESPKGTSAWRGAAADYGVSPAGGSVKLDLNGVPGAAGREAAAAGEQAAGREAAAGAGRAGEAAADGGVSELAHAGNVGRETAAGAATGSVSEGVDSASQQLIQHIRSGTLDEMERAWIEATAAGAAKAPGTVDASTQAILNEARAAGILGRDAAGTAGANGAVGAGRAGEAAGTAARQGESKAAGTLSNYDRQQYNSYIDMVRNDPDLADLVSPTLDRVVGSTGRSIDSLSDAELSAFYNALNDAVNGRWVAEAFLGGL